MEGIFRLSSPLLYFTYTSIGLALLLGGDYNRRGQFWRIFIAVCTVSFVQVAVLGAKNFGEKSAEIATLMYAVPIVATIVLLVIITSSKPKIRKRRLNGTELAQ